MKTFPSIEPLEARIAPAGVVTATLAAGKLTLAGDIAANDLGVDVTAPGHFTVTGNGGTTIVFNGAPAAATVAVDGVFAEFVSDLGGDNDSLTLSHLLLSKGITITDTLGNNTYALNSVDVAGTIAFTLGGGDDTVSLTSFLLGAKAITASLGDGANSFTLGANLTELGSLTVTGGTGNDTFSIPGGDLNITGAFTAALGEGANTATVTAGSLRVGGALTISHGSHAAGTAVTMFNGGEVDVKGATLLSFVDGDNQVTIQSRGATFRGLLTLQGGSSTDSFTLNGSDLQCLGGIKVLGGEGANSLNLSSTSRLFKSFSYTGGAGTDNLSSFGTVQTVTGATTIVLGAGTNNMSGGSAVATYLGLVKVTGGADDDSISVAASSLRLAKGVTIDGGTGANITNVAGDVLWSSGPISLINGNHLAGTSFASVAGTQVRADSGVTATFGDGTKQFDMSPTTQATIKGNVTVSTPGAGSFTVNINPAVLTVTGKIAITGGIGGATVSVQTQQLKLGGFQLTDGAGDVSVNIQSDGTISGVTSFNVGAGSDGISILGRIAGLTLKGGLNITSQSGNANGESLTLRDLNLLGATKIIMGAANGSVDVREVLTGAFSLDAGAGSDNISVETSDDDIVSIFGGPVSFLLGSGVNSLTIGNNTALGKANFKSTVKIVGGSETDTFTNNGNLFLAGQPVVTNVP